MMHYGRNENFIHNSDQKTKRNEPTWEYGWIILKLGLKVMGVIVKTGFTWLKAE
jgi:hypothetical protein